MKDTRIEWCHHTWSPWIGCQKTGSPACEHCYAEALMDTRLGRVEWGPHGERKLTSDAYWAEPAKWDRAAAISGEPVRVFPSLCDPFDNKAPPGARVRFGQRILSTPNLTWLLLTKRIGNAAEMLREMFPGGMPANVWLGATVVTQAEADRDVPKLLATPAAKRFLSMEPLLGPVDLTRIHETFDDGLGHSWESALNGKRWSDWGGSTGDGGDVDGAPKLDWIIVGGESGPGARITPIGATRFLRDQCTAANVAFLHKQHGEWIHESQLGWLNPMLDIENARWELIDGESYYRVGKKTAGRLLDGVQHDAVPHPLSRAEGLR